MDLTMKAYIEKLYGFLQAAETTWAHEAPTDRELEAFTSAFKAFGEDYYQNAEKLFFLAVQQTETALVDAHEHQRQDDDILLTIASKLAVLQNIRDSTKDWTELPNFKDLIENALSMLRSVQTCAKNESAAVVFVRAQLHPLFCTVELERIQVPLYCWLSQVLKSSDDFECRVMLQGSEHGQRMFLQLLFNSKFCHFSRNIHIRSGDRRACCGCVPKQCLHAAVFVFVLATRVQCFKFFRKRKRRSHSKQSVGFSQGPRVCFEPRRTRNNTAFAVAPLFKHPCSELSCSRQSHAAARNFVLARYIHAVHCFNL